MVMGVELVIRGRKRGIRMKAMNKSELRLYTKIATKLFACKSPDEIDLLLANY